MRAWSTRNTSGGTRRTMLYSALRPIIGIALNWYYRSVAVAGRSRIPASGPVFLAVNHPNALVDALVVGWTVPRPVRFTAKATIFANPVVGQFLRAVGVVPLRRASDELKRVPQTAGTTDAGPSAPLDPARNAESFRAVSDALSEGGAVVIFPEGRSHDEPQLAPLRTGLARMALSARDDAGVRGIRILPIGLLFEQKEAPRSRVLVQVGDAIDLDSLDGGDRPVESLTAIVAERLKAVTLNFETANDARRIAAVSDTMSELLAPVVTIGQEGPSLSEQLEVARRAERVRKAVERNQVAGLAERVAAFETRLQQFRARLRQLHIAPADLAIDVAAAPGIRFAIRELAVVALLAPVALWGRITHLVPIRLARALAVRNVSSRDEPAMRTLVIGVALVLTAYVIETILVATMAGPWWAIAFFLSLLPSASSDLRYGDRARRRRERMRTYLRFRSDQSLQRALLADADWLRREAGAIEQSAIGEG
jgi:glycerol-3-phosphate O-acyltransferase/dihydroxyacetone phosphate acyltransferase